jgi:hypothetical protein
MVMHDRNFTNTVLHMTSTREPTLRGTSQGPFFGVSAEALLSSPCLKSKNMWH